MHVFLIIILFVTSPLSLLFSTQSYIWRGENKNKDKIKMPRKLKKKLKGCVLCSCAWQPDFLSGNKTGVVSGIDANLSAL